jgi:chromosome segregation ATPase
LIKPKVEDNREMDANHQVKAMKQQNNDMKQQIQSLQQKKQDLEMQHTNYKECIKIYRRKIKRHYSNFLKNSVFPFLVTIFRHAFQTYRDEFLKTEGGCFQERAYSKKLLSLFTQLSRFGRIKEIFEAIFPRNSPNFG